MPCRKEPQDTRILKTPKLLPVLAEARHRYPSIQQSGKGANHVHVVEELRWSKANRTRQCMIAS